MEFIYLQGSEGVQQAGHQMAAAADTIARAISDLQAILFEDRQAREQAAYHTCYDEAGMPRG